jgi:hypothetical protein
MPAVGARRPLDPAVEAAAAEPATGRAQVPGLAASSAAADPDGGAVGDPAPAVEPAQPEPIPTGNAAPLADPMPDPATAPGTGPATGPPHGGVRGDGTSTLVFRRPVPVPTRALLRLVARDGAERAIEVDGTPLAIGRAADNGLVVADPRVSRHHARLQARRGTLVLTDLGSTNGTRVNGVRVDECALGAGDRVLMGDTVLLVEQLPD